MPETITARRALTPRGVVDHVALTFEDGQVQTVDAVAPGGPYDADWLVPGFVDTHVHGGGGASYATLDPEEARAVAAFGAAHGATTTLASLVTAPLPTLCAQLDVLADLAAEGVIAGVHLEGPFLSPARKGAHDPGLLVDPDPDSVRRLLDAGRGQVRMITIAPELTYATEAIAYCRSRGVVVAVGHTDGDATTVLTGVDAGASVATHLFNAMRPIHHREPGPVPALLTDGRVTVELICDGFHLHPDALRLSIAAAGPERVALVTDAMVATGMPAGRYGLGDLDVEVHDGQARLVDADGTPGSIAGSTLTMAAAVAYVVGTVGCSVADAATMAATTPARAHGLDAGSLGPARPADAVLLDDRGRLQRVLHRGRWLDRP